MSDTQSTEFLVQIGHNEIPVNYDDYHYFSLFKTLRNEKKVVLDECYTIPFNILKKWIDIGRITKMEFNDDTTLYYFIEMLMYFNSTSEGPNDDDIILTILMMYISMIPNSVCIELQKKDLPTYMKDYLEKEIAKNIIYLKTDNKICKFSPCKNPQCWRYHPKDKKDQEIYMQKLILELPQSVKLYGYKFITCDREQNLMPLIDYVCEKNMIWYKNVLRYGDYTMLKKIDPIKINDDYDKMIYNDEEYYYETFYLKNNKKINTEMADIVKYAIKDNVLYDVLFDFLDDSFELHKSKDKCQFDSNYDIIILEGFSLYYLDEY